MPCFSWHTVGYMKLTCSCCVLLCCIKSWVIFPVFLTLDNFCPASSMFSSSKNVKCLWWCALRSPSIGSACLWRLTCFACLHYTAFSKLSEIAAKYVFSLLLTVYNDLFATIFDSVSLWHFCNVTCVYFDLRYFNCKILLVATYSKVFEYG